MNNYYANGGFNPYNNGMQAYQQPPYMQNGQFNNINVPQPVNPAPVQQESWKTNAEFIQVSNIQQVYDHNVPVKHVLWFINTVEPYMYAKSADEFGTTNVKIIRTEEVQANAINATASNPSPITRQEFDDLKRQMHEYENRLNAMSRPVPEYAGGAANESTHEHDPK